MTPSELYTLFREDVVDTAVPYLWSDTELYAYMNDAYFMFVRLTGGIADGTSDVTQITAELGEERSALDLSIMRIRTALNITDNSRPLKVINVQDIDSLTTDDYSVVRRVSQPAVPGVVRHMVIGEEEGSVRWVNLPDKDYEIQLVVERLPSSPITANSTTFTDVREEHHFHLLKWMRHLAYRKQDADTFDLVKSNEERDDFIAYCDLAKKEKGIRKHKVRTTSYGGI